MTPVSNHNEIFQAAYKIGWETGVFVALPPAAFDPDVRREIERSINLFDQALAMLPQNWPAHWLRAKCLLGLNLYQSALDGFSQAWLLDPSQHCIAREAGVSAMEGGRPDVAVYYTQEALKLCPVDSGLHANLAMAHLFAGNTQAAVSEAAAAELAAPDDPITQAVALLIGEVAAGRMPRPNHSQEIDAEAVRRASLRLDGA